MLCFLVKYSINETEEAGGRSTPHPQGGPLLRDMSTKMEGPGVCEEMRTARWFSTSFRPPFISSRFASLLHRFPLGIMASATSDFRPLTFSFRFEPFVFTSERNVFPPLPETFCFRAIAIFV